MKRNDSPDFVGLEELKRKQREQLYNFECWAASGKWNELREENSPLRASVNGKILSVPEDFYDFLIWKHLTKEPVKEARLIGSLLGKNQISVSDVWYAKRIDHYIEQGRITIVEDSENKYARMICMS